MVKVSETNGQAGRAGRDFTESPPLPIQEIQSFISDYVLIPEPGSLIIANWVLASWMDDLWDRFPYLVISSPEKRCGKTRLLEVLRYICRRPQSVVAISRAALYRMVDKSHPTLLIDEAQSIGRTNSEYSQAMTEILNAGISKDAAVPRCDGDNYNPHGFKIYCPKVIALIGNLDGTLNDRCLPIRLERCDETGKLKRFRSRLVEGPGRSVVEGIEEWVKRNKEKTQEEFDTNLDPVDIRNDRLAELLTPLHAVLSIADPDRLDELMEYARSVDKADLQEETLSVRLLSAIREYFLGDDKKDFAQTSQLIAYLVNEREEEPWGRLVYGRPINPERLAALLKPFSIRSEKSRTGKSRGYYRSSLEPAWARYLPPIPSVKSRPARQTRLDLGPPTLSGNRVNCVSRVKK